MHLMLFGGAFDPLHYGHVEIIHYLLSIPSLDQLVLIPTGQPVHKKTTYFPANLRFGMLNSVFDNQEKVTVSDFEIKKKQPSYTVDSIDYFKQVYHPQKLSLVVGFDQFYQFHRWRKYQFILSQCDLVVILRQGMDHSRLMDSLPAELNDFKDKFTIHDMYPMAISSTQLRIMIKKRRDISSFVPNQVLNIIKQFETEKNT